MTRGRSRTTVGAAGVPGRGMAAALPRAVVVTRSALFALHARQRELREFVERGGVLLLELPQLSERRIGVPAATPSPRRRNDLRVHSDCFVMAHFLPGTLLRKRS